MKKKYISKKDGLDRKEVVKNKEGAESFTETIHRIFQDQNMVFEKQYLRYLLSQ